VSPSRPSQSRRLCRPDLSRPFLLNSLKVVPPNGVAPPTPSLTSHTVMATWALGPRSRYCCDRKRKCGRESGQRQQVHQTTRDDILLLPEQPTRCSDQLFNRLLDSPLVRM